jgi:trans-aconitate methyltransferase
VRAYDPHTYWLAKDGIPRKRGHDAQEAALQSVISYLDVQSILEIGVGSGRIAGILTQRWPGADYTGIDLSADRIEETRRIVGERANLVQTDVRDYAPRRRFEMVVASEVLMHIQPEHVGAVIADLTSWSSRYVLTIDWTEPITRPVMPHNFIHDYQGHGLTPVAVVGKQTIFLTEPTP